MRTGKLPRRWAPARALASCLVLRSVGHGALLVDVRQGHGSVVIPDHATLALAGARRWALFLSPRRVDVRQALVELVGEALEEAVHALELFSLGVDLPVVVLLDVLCPGLNLPGAHGSRQEHHVHLVVDARLRCFRVATAAHLQTLELVRVLRNYCKHLLLPIELFLEVRPSCEVQLDQPALGHAVHAVQRGVRVVLVLLHQGLHVFLNLDERLRVRPLCNLLVAVQEPGCNGVAQEPRVLLAGQPAEDLLRVVGLRLRDSLEPQLQPALRLCQLLLDLRVLHLVEPGVEDHADERLVLPRRAAHQHAAGLLHLLHLVVQELLLS
mmetsp:Transcript_80328/g.210988  ORF Transcript_80328/g.210988 Transcript_80328/m.210988 type:complete len:325 (+) Transcript_80328:379-1353(+)